MVADEFGVPEFAVKDVCGPVGKVTEISFEDRLEMLRSKMSHAGFIPVNNPKRFGRFNDDEPQEIRPCVMCEEFLDDDDAGETVVNSETSEPGVVCQKCVEARART